MKTRYDGLVMASMMLLVFSSGAMAGATADNLGEATIDVDGLVEDVKTDNSSEPAGAGELGPAEPWAQRLDALSIDTPLDPYVEAAVGAYTGSVVRMAAKAANWGAYVGFHYLSWVPQPVFAVVGFASVLPVCYGMLRMASDNRV